MVKGQAKWMKGCFVKRRGKRGIYLEDFVPLKRHTNAELSVKRRGKMVSLRHSGRARLRHNDSSEADEGLKRWQGAVRKARRDLGVKGFCPVKKGTMPYDL